jgi:hypothetical protein
LLAFVAWRPIFIFPFLTAIIPLIAQFDILPGHSWAVPNLPIRILILFFSFYLYHLLTKRKDIADFVFLLACLIAAHYWLSGYGKLNIEWLLNDGLHYIMPTTYANGWLSHMTPEKMSAFAQGLSAWDIPARIFTIFIEFGAILFLWHRRSVRLFLIAWIIMHIGVFMLSGICFWIWTTLDLALLFLFLKKDGISSLPIFDTRHLLLAIVLIGGGNIWCSPPKLSWHDSPVSYTYRFAAATESGQELQLTPGFFAPYDYQFTLSGFGYLNTEPTMPITWGATGAELSRLLGQAGSTQEVLDYEQEFAVPQYDSTRAGEFEAFMRRYIENWNARLSKNVPLSQIQPPRQLWTFPRDPFHEMPEPIVKIKVYEVLSFFNNGQYSEIRNKSILVIPLIE